MRYAVYIEKYMQLKNTAREFRVVRLY